MSAVETKLVGKIQLSSEKLAEVENSVDFITSQAQREADFDAAGHPAGLWKAPACNR